MTDKPTTHHGGSGSRESPFDPSVFRAAHYRRDPRCTETTSQSRVMWINARQQPQRHDDGRPRQRSHKSRASAYRRLPDFADAVHWAKYIRFRVQFTVPVTVQGSRFTVQGSGSSGFRRHGACSRVGHGRETFSRSCGVAAVTRVERQVFAFTAMLPAVAISIIAAKCDDRVRPRHGTLLKVRPFLASRRAVCANRSRIFGRDERSRRGSIRA
jgi:hypothetical protein